MVVTVLIALVLPDSDSQSEIDPSTQIENAVLMMPDFVGLELGEIQSSLPNLEESLPTLEVRNVNGKGEITGWFWNGRVSSDSTLVVAQYPPPGTPIEEVRDSFLVTGDSDRKNEVQTGYTIDPDGGVVRVPVWSGELSMREEMSGNGRNTHEVFRLADFGFLATSDGGCEIPDGYLLTADDGVSAKWLTEPCGSHIASSGGRFLVVTVAFGYEVDYTNFRGSQFYCLEVKLGLKNEFLTGETWRGCTEDLVPDGESVGTIWVPARIILVTTDGDNLVEVVSNLVNEFEAGFSRTPFLYVLPPELAESRWNLEVPCAVEEKVVIGSYGPNRCW